MQRVLNVFEWLGGAGVGLFDSPITKTNNQTMDTSKLKYYISLAFGLAT
jgi:hypothetical protein